MATGEREFADGDVLRALHLEEGIERGDSDLAFGDRFLRPKIQRAGMLVVKPLAGRIQLFEGVLEVVAVVRVEVVAAILL